MLKSLLGSALTEQMLEFEKKQVVTHNIYLWKSLWSNG